LDNALAPKLVNRHVLYLIEFAKMSGFTLQALELSEDEQSGSLITMSFGFKEPVELPETQEPIQENNKGPAKKDPFGTIDD
jgi:hypothetical protein